MCAKKVPQVRFFRLLLTLKSGGHLVGRQYKSGALNLLHGFASASSAPLPAVNSKYEAHRHLHQSFRHFSNQVAVQDAMRGAERRIGPKKGCWAISPLRLVASIWHIGGHGTASQSLINFVDGIWSGSVVSSRCLDFCCDRR